MKRTITSLTVVGAAIAPAFPQPARAAVAPMRVTLTQARSIDASDWPEGRRLLDLPPVTLDAGQSVLLRGRLQGKNESTLNAEQQVGVGCDDIEGGTLRTSRNNEGIDRRYGPGYGVLTIDARYLFTAPAAGTYTCSLWAKSSSNTITALGTGGTLIEVSDPGPGAAQWLGGPCDSRGTVSNTPDVPDDSECVYLVPSTTEQIGTGYPSSTYTLVQPAFVADPAATRVVVLADLQVSTCYLQTGNCLDEVDQYGDPSSRPRAVVDSRLEVLQLGTDGAFASCGARGFSPPRGEGSSPDGNFSRTTITRNVHHLKLRFQLTFPVSVAETCARTFLVRVFIRSVEGDPVKLEGSRITRAGVVRLAFTNAIALNGF